MREASGAASVPPKRVKSDSSAPPRAAAASAPPNKSLSMGSMARRQRAAAFPVQQEVVPAKRGRDAEMPAAPAAAPAEPGAAPPVPPAAPGPAPVPLPPESVAVAALQAARRPPKHHKHMSADQQVEMERIVSDLEIEMRSIDLAERLGGGAFGARRAMTLQLLHGARQARCGGHCGWARRLPSSCCCRTAPSRRSSGCALAPASLAIQARGALQNAFFREALLLCKMRFPNIVRVFGVIKVRCRCDASCVAQTAAESPWHRDGILPQNAARTD